MPSLSEGPPLSPPLPVEGPAEDALPSRAQAALPRAARAFPLPRRLVVAGAVVAGLFTFILALELLKTGAAGVAVLLRALSVDGAANAMGFGWLMAYVAMSGSPVAATALTLLGGGVLSPLETFGMISGSRFGASFLVLFTGFIYYLRGWRGRGVVAMGILSMAATATIYLPAVLLGLFALRGGWLEGIRIGSPRALTSVVDVVYDPITRAASAYLHPVLIFVAGFLVLLAAFRLFDRALPPMGSDVLETRWVRWLNQPWTMFVVGLVVTSLTLSVSVALSVLVPLAGRGLVKRPQVIPYIMGANITTFIDTLFAALLIREPAAFTIVLTLMASVGVISLIVLALFFRWYRRALLDLNAFVTRTRVGFALFVAALAILPLALLLS